MELERHLTDAEFRWEVAHTGRLSQRTLQITLIVLTSVALASFMGRLSIRILVRRRVELDDAFLTLAVACTCASTAIVHRYIFPFYLSNALLLRPELKKEGVFLQLVDDLKAGAKPRDVLGFTSWTTLYGVKFCFLVFFRPLLRHIKSLKLYWWTCALFCTIAWGISAFKALKPSPQPTSGSALRAFIRTNIVFAVAVSVLDIASDIMIVSIPILVLRHTTLKRSTKFSVAFFLSLSIFMVICALIRIAGVIPGKLHVPDTTWRMFWTQTECSVAIIMASITALRTLFVETQKNSLYRIRSRYGVPLERNSNLHRGGMGGLAADKVTGDIELLTIPSSAHTSTRPLARHSVASEISVAESEIDPPESVYHAAIREGRMPANVKHDRRTTPAAYESIGTI
ncbi:hypothetical protein P154DRAFT_558970 [Amniculicola lignicola CBS 123094]|uniref:Rhodopsin domain-containing protein n=1 Tax=Amniculicola lignicola CBS 123094 TaxID=1392246 RepID=A0A6A5X0I1_9PLEO|nr:hypothetical protein P154DRAFT_558970 [Amniculicola lignicola CBS 123094]